MIALQSQISFILRIITRKNVRYGSEILSFDSGFNQIQILIFVEINGVEIYVSTADVCSR
jgi:hypothetical protein